MKLDSIEFLFIFLPCLILVNTLLPHKFRPLVLTLSSIAFLFLLQPQMLLMVLVFVLCDYVLGFVLSKTQNKVLRTFILTVSILFNLSVFVLSQYFEIMPYIVGVSVISLVKITYIVSIYNGKITSTDNVIAYLANVLCFPTLMAGPINEYAQISYTVKNDKKSLSKFGNGASQFIYGLFKKVVIADNISMLLSSISPDNVIPKDALGAILWVLCHLFVLLYTLLGYSQMAVGICKMLGFELKSNFNYPFMSTSVKDFFRRFNISLNNFAKKYIYIPLGGNQKGRVCMITSTLVATLLSTLWYGFSLNTVLCAFYFAVIIIFEKLLSKGKNGPKILLNILTMVMLVPGYLLLITNEPSDFSYLVSSLFGQNHVLFASDLTKYYLGNYAVFIFFAVFFLFDFGNRIYKRVSHSKKWYVNVLVSSYNVLLLALCVAFML